MFYYLALIVSSLVAGVVQGISGFALGMTFITLIQFMLPYGTTTGLSSLMSAIIIGISALTNRKNIQWRALPAPFLLFSAFDILMLQVLKYTLGYPHWFKLMGVLFILSSIYILFFDKRVNLTFGRGMMVFLCSLGGVCNGLFAVGGPPIAMYFLAAIEEKEHYYSTMQVYCFMVATADTIGRIASGLVTSEIILPAAVCFLPMVGGLLLGKMVFDRISKQTLKYIVYSVIMLSGLYMLFLK